MALDGTATKVGPGQDIGDGELIVLDLQGPSSYANGGEVFTGRGLGLRVGSRVSAVEGRALDPGDGYAKLNGTTGLLEFFDSLGVEIADTTDLSAFTYRLTIHGR